MALADHRGTALGSLRELASANSWFRETLTGMVEICSRLVDLAEKLTQTG